MGTWSILPSLWETLQVGGSSSLVPRLIRVSALATQLGFVSSQQFDWCLFVPSCFSGFCFLQDARLIFASVRSEPESTKGPCRVTLRSFIVYILWGGGRM